MTASHAARQTHADAHETRDTCPNITHTHHINIHTCVHGVHVNMYKAAHVHVHGLDIYLHVNIHFHGHGAQ